MHQSDTVGELAGALAKAQATFAKLTKDKVADAGTYSYRYIDLSTVIEHTKKGLCENGLAITQAVDVSDGQTILVTTLIHSSGEWMKSQYPLPSPTQVKPQAFGSAISYARRYSLQSMLNVMADEDDDGAKAQNTASQPRPEPQAQRPPNHAPGAENASGGLADFVIPKGRLEGKALKDCSYSEIKESVDFFTANGTKTPRGWPKKVVEYFETIKDQNQASYGEPPPPDWAEEIPF